jgi:rhodanese-related sulfurtransferase/DNA-binding transcriptional ArsR family regulator
MGHRGFKDRIYPEFARVGHALASDRRLELLDLLAQGPRNVEALAAETEQPVANVSQHLQVLRRARLVEAEREGTRVRYRLADRAVLELWLSLRKVAEARLPELEQITSEYAGAEANPPLPRGELQKLLKRGDVHVIDVRPTLEYESGHLPGAQPIPVEELPTRLSELPRNKRIIAYCRGAYCLFADEAVALLRKNGFDAQRIEGGWAEWLAEGRPTRTARAR